MITFSILLITVSALILLYATAEQIYQTHIRPDCDHAAEEDSRSPLSIVHYPLSITHTCPRCQPVAQREAKTLENLKS